jgi:phosphoglycerate-specific signal transduction histidine kinase
MKTADPPEALMGQLATSIVHEITQPLTATVSNAQAALRWLSGQPPNLQEVRLALDRIVKDGKRARDVVGRIRSPSFTRRHLGETASRSMKPSVRSLRWRVAKS